MEDCHYSELKSSLSTISVKALNYSSRLILVNNLDFRHALLSEKGFARDYRGLAELVGFQYNAIKQLEESQDPTMKILELWETRPEETLDKLITYLEDMDRHDIIQELIPSLASFDPVNLSSEKWEMFTRDDQETGECTMYDAFVFYVVEDESIVKKISTFLESPEIGLKLFIRERDMLPGCVEYADIELLKNRCRCVLIILTPNFIKSPAMAFYQSFATSLAYAYERKEIILVPVIFGPCEIPPLLNCVTKIDFTKQNINNWEIYKLITSLVPEDKKVHQSTACSEMYQSAACIDLHQSAACSESKETSSPHKKSSKKLKQFMSFLKRKVFCGPDVKLSSQNWNMITRHDLKSGECTFYDAYVCYVDEDTYIVAELAEILESPLIGYKLFIHGRDMLLGCVALDSNIELIKKRCRCMLIILTPNFIKSSEMLFYLSFAGTLSIEQKERILVPVIIVPCEVPLILNSVCKIDFTNQNIDDWEMYKLITSLMPEDKKMHQSSACSESKEVSSPPKQPSKKFHQFMSFIRRRWNSKRASSTLFPYVATN